MGKLTNEEIAGRLENLKGWEYINDSIEKAFIFANFKEAFAIMTRIAFECEEQNHHPDWTNVYKTVNVRLSTHDAGGVTEKDFILAESIESIVNNP